MIYGYARISTAQQNIDRQIRNIKEMFNDAHIIKEVFTGTKVEGRTEFQKLLKTLKEGDTVVFDSVSRMSRNAKEGFDLYQKLYAEGVNLVFIKEPQINTDTYKNAIQIEMTGTDADCILEGINRYLMRLAEKQITIAFEQAQKEVDDLRQRTKEGLTTAKLNGKQIGRAEGSTITTKKSTESKEKIRKLSKSFDGNLSDKEVMSLLGLARNTYYKYKKEMTDSSDDIYIITKK